MAIPNPILYQRSKQMSRMIPRPNTTTLREGVRCVKKLTEYQAFAVETSIKRTMCVHAYAYVKNSDKEFTFVLCTVRLTIALVRIINSGFHPILTGYAP